MSDKRLIHEPWCMLGGNHKPTSGCIPRTADDESSEVTLLVRELFSMIESAQGYFHVSDGERFRTKREFFDRIRGRLNYGKRAVQIMEMFLERHGELR